MKNNAFQSTKNDETASHAGDLTPPEHLVSTLVFRRHE